jgi:hypothetical protein
METILGTFPLYILYINTYTQHIHNTYIYTQTNKQTHTVFAKCINFRADAANNIKYFLYMLYNIHRRDLKFNQ